MTTYSLKMHSYNVYDPLGLSVAARHTGYNLVVTDNNGNTTIYGIDFGPDINNPDKAHIFITESSAKKFIFTNKENPNITQEAYWSADTTQEDISKYEFYNSKELASGNDALEIFNKIKLDAALTNLVNQIDYELGIPWVDNGRVCNTATNYWGLEYIPNFDTNIYNSLPDKTTFGYWGHNDDYINASNYEQAKKLEFINKLVNALDDVGAIDDILTNNEPYISEKYLQILQPFLEHDFIYNGEDILINKFLSDVAQGGVNFAVIAGLTSAINTKYVDIASIQSSFTAAENNPSPLILDLDGDGKVETTRSTNGTHFDHDGNGFAESTGWVGKDDGLLVRDINGNGQIDNGTELFGNNSVLSSGKKAANGFEALKDLDSNNDGMFNNLDTAWNEVKVWKDTNQNGIVDNGELLTLEQAGVLSIKLDYSNLISYDGNNNVHRQQGTFIRTDGTTAAVHDVWFDTDYADTKDKCNIEIPDNIKNLPEIKGFGNVHSLQETMAMDNSGTLKTLIEQYIEETNALVRKEMIDNIIFHWAGVQDIDPESRKPNFIYNNPIKDARYLETLERFLGEKYSNRYWFGVEANNPHAQAALALLEGFDKLVNYVTCQLEMQTHSKEVMENIKMTWNETTKNWDIDISGVVAIFNNLAQKNMSEAVYLLHIWEDIINQQNFLTEQINSAFQNCEVSSTELQIYFTNFGKMENRISSGNDIVYGTEGDDFINTFEGNDKIYGRGGNDTLIGGAGDDYLVGGEGSDTYFFEGSWGHDFIDNSSAEEKGTSTDIIQFGEGISPSDVMLKRQGNDLILSLHDDADTVTIYSYFLEAGKTTNTVDLIKFADGTSWYYEYVRVAWNRAPITIGETTVLNGTDENDNIYGTTGNDIITGEDGNDYISADNGNDIIYGGKGDDRLYGGNGDDTYVWNWGDGLDEIYDSGNNDTIFFTGMITPENLTYRCEGNYLRIIVNGDETQGVLINYFFNNINNKIENLRFANGENIRLSEIGLTLTQKDTDEHISSTEFDDIIYANGGHDQITSGTGNDTVYGGRGDDTINTSNGNNILYGESGQDTINGGDGNDIIIGGKGIDTLKGNGGDDIYIYNIGDGFDYITDYDWNNSPESNDIIRFGEGISFSDLTFKRINNHLQITLFGDCTQGMQIESFFNGRTYSIEKLEFADGTSFNLSKTGLTLQQSNGDDRVTGTQYDDIIYGYDGDDELLGDRGNDTLIGGKGDDYLFGSYGTNTYVWNLGDGLDTISSLYETQGIIQFGEGISFTDLKFEILKTEDSLRLYVNNDKTQGIIFSNFYTSHKYLLKFADGTEYNLEEQGLTFTQSDISEYINIPLADSIIYAGNGDNTITLNGGTNIVSAGKGNDTISGYNSNGTFIWNIGDGLDTLSFRYSGNGIIQFGEGISFDDLVFEQDGIYHNLFYKGDRTQGIKGFRLNDFTLKFSDGSSIELSEAPLKLIQTDASDNSVSGSSYNDEIYGNGGDDKIYANAGDDIISGGKGNDSLYGGEGNDTYLWNFGDGFDYIDDSYGENKIKFGQGISFEDLSFAQTNLNLYIFVKGDFSQGINIYRKNISLLEFSDGSIVDLSTKEIEYIPYESLNLSGNNTDQTFIGSDFNDTINTGSGNNHVTGGKGNDKLTGGNGNDTYYYNLGDGFDEIYDNNGFNKIIFGEGISWEDLSFSKSSSGVIINIKKMPGHGILLSGQANSSNIFPISELHFSDGTIKDLTSTGYTFIQPNIDNNGTAIRGTNFDDIFYDGDGNSYIQAGAGNDTLIGGKGNDILDGGSGNNIFIYNLGDGCDTIKANYNVSDIIRFGDGITADCLTFTSINTNDLQISINNDPNQRILIENFRLTNSVKTLEFANGTSMDLTQGLTYTQTNGNDDLSATDFNDVINAGEGDDKIYAGKGDDIIIGGKGNDQLDGGTGANTFIYNIGDGRDIILNQYADQNADDKIKFGEGITLEDLIFTKKGDGLVISFKNHPDQKITLERTDIVGLLEFSDGSSYDIVNQGLTYIQSNANEDIRTGDNDDTIYAGDGHDDVYAGNGNNIIIGGKGNDTLNGGNGNDTYVWNLDDGFDTISDSSGNDKILFGEGISLNDLTFEQIGTNLRITINNDETQGIQINGQTYSSNKVETIEFHDGSTLDISNADQLIQAMNSFSISNSASTDTLSNPTQDVSDMYSLAASQDLTRKAI